MPARKIPEEYLIPEPTDQDAPKKKFKKYKRRLCVTWDQMSNDELRNKLLQLYNTPSSRKRKTSDSVNSSEDVKMSDRPVKKIKGMKHMHKELLVQLCMFYDYAQKQKAGKLEAALCETCKCGCHQTPTTSQTPTVVPIANEGSSSSSEEEGPDRVGGDSSSVALVV